MTLLTLRFSHFSYIVPGPVSNLTAVPRVKSIDLTWSAPQEPNGVIIRYEITYRVAGSNLTTINITGSTTTFSISSLSPLVTVFNISVSAYTSIGRGETFFIDSVTTISELL